LVGIDHFVQEEENYFILAEGDPESDETPHPPKRPEITAEATTS